MPTPMHVYRDIAAHYGVDVASRKAPSQFFNHDLPRFPAEVQLTIAQQLRERAGEAVR
jgi:hypothetical protein